MMREKLLQAAKPQTKTNDVIIGDGQLLPYMDL